MLVTLKKQVPFFRYALLLIGLVTLVALFFKSDFKEAREEAQREAELRKEAARPKVRTVKAVSEVLVVTAPAKGTRSEPVVIDEVGPRPCWYSKGNVSVWYDNGSGTWKGPIPDGPGRNVNLGKFVGTGALVFESEDSRPVQIHFRDDCLS